MQGHLKCRQAFVAIAVLTVGGCEAGTDPVAGGGPSPRARRTLVQDASFTEWTEPVNLGPVVNAVLANTRAAGTTPDDLALYVTSDRVGGLGDTDIWVTRRASRDEPWSEPVHLDAPLNSAFIDVNPNLSPDGRHLFFNSTRPGGCGANDIWRSSRENPEDDFGWRPPVNLGCVVNSVGIEQGPAILVDPETGDVSLYFARGAIGSRDIFVTSLDDDGNWRIPTPVLELNSTFDEARPTIRSDGLEIFFWSEKGSRDHSRPGGHGRFNVWTSTRASVDDAWSSPAPVFANQSIPALSFDGTVIYLSGFRTGDTGLNDVFVSTRERVNQLEP